MTSRRSAGIIAAIVAVLAAFSTIMITQVGAQSDPIQELAAAESSEHILPAVDLVPDNESKFVTMTPCRLVDTRTTQPLSAGSTRTFRSRDPLTSQGGNPAGCGIPAGVDSISVNLTAIFATGNGFLRAWEAGTPQPTATLLNYTNAFNVSNAVVIPVDSTAAGAFTVEVFGQSTGLVVDVVGYSIPGLGGAIAADGTIIPGHGESRIVSSERLTSGPNNGKYLITFDRSIERCNAFVTPATQNRIASVVFTDNVATVTLNDQATGAIVGGIFFIVADC
jgi:hypothetical protein